MSSTLRTPGTIRLFGHPDRTVALAVVPRSRRWRMKKAATQGGAGYALILLTPLPPHLGWLFGGLAAGTFFGLRKWKERFTLTGIDGACPQCESELALESETRLREELSLDCGSCNHTLSLEVDLAEAEAASDRR